MATKRVAKIMRELVKSLDSGRRYGAAVWEGIEDETERELSDYAAFYDRHKATKWKPMMVSRGVPDNVLPVIVPCADKNADGHIFYQAFGPPRIARLPVRQLNPKELAMPGSVLWNDHISETDKLVSALEADRGVSKIVHELLSDDPSLHQQASENPWAYAACLLNSGLSSAKAPIRFAVWWRHGEKRLDLGLYCPDPRAAAYALLLKRGRKIIRVATCAHCGVRFVQNEWHPRKYCNRRCTNAASQAGSRRRKAKGKVRRLNN